MVRIQLLLLLLWRCSLAAQGQPYHFRHYQVENGLSHNTVYSSIQDKAGFLWFGTKDGLNRFDGYRFKKISLGTESQWSFNPDRVFDLYQDNRGVLWAGTDKGLYHYDALHEKLVPLSPSLPKAGNITMSGGMLWFTSGSRLCRYSPLQKKVTVFPAAATGAVSAVCSGPGNGVWIGTTDGWVKKLDTSGRVLSGTDVFQHSAPVALHHIQVLYPAGSGGLFIGTSSQGIKLLQTADGTYKDLLTHNEDKTSVYVRDVLAASEQEFWFATESGIFILDLPTMKFTNLKKRFLDPYTLLDNAVYTLSKDREGGIWAGTFFGGVNYFAARAFAFAKYFPNYTPNSISGSVVREICPDGKGNLWIGTEDAGLNQLHLQTGRIKQYKPTGAPGGIAYTNIHGLLAVQNELWIGTFEHGLDVMNIETGKVVRHYGAGPGPDQLKSNFIVSLCQTKNGAIYIGTSEGVYRHLPYRGGFKRLDFVPNGVFVSAVVEDSRQTLWIATHENGVYYLNTLTGKSGNLRNSLQNKNSLPSNTINSIFEDARGRLWFATEGGGLTCLSGDRKTFARYTTANGLPSNFVFKVLADKKGTLWATTSKGLCNLEPATGRTRLYTKESGLLNDQFNYGSGYMDASGTLYFGSTKGMIAFKPAGAPLRTGAPPLYITGFQVHNKEAEIGSDSSLLQQSIIHTQKITLPHNQSSFSVNYSALSFTAPEMTAYSYKMEGLDQAWTELKNNRSIYFTNLSPGQYTLRIKAMLNGAAVSAQKKLIVAVLPPWWASRWAYAGYALLAAAALYLLLRTYHGYMESIKEKEIYEAKIDFFTNIAHEIRTPLTLIKGPVENLMEQVDSMPQIKEDVAMMARNTGRLVALVTQILDFRKTETKNFSLYFGKVNIGELVKEEWESFAGLAKKRQLQYHLYLPETAVTAVADEEALRKILSNLFSNAIKYADKKVWADLKIKKEEEALLLEVCNDGNLIPKEAAQRIFEPFFRLKETARQKGTGIGLALARSLTLLHGGSLYLQDTDRGYNCFVLRLPLRPAKPAPKKKSLFARTKII